MTGARRRGRLRVYRRLLDAMPLTAGRLERFVYDISSRSDSVRATGGRCAGTVGGSWRASQDADRRHAQSKTRARERSAPRDSDQLSHGNDAASLACRVAMPRASLVEDSLIPSLHAVLREHRREPVVRLPAVDRHATLRLPACRAPAACSTSATAPASSKTNSPRLAIARSARRTA